MNLSFYLKKLKGLDLSRFTETAKRVSSITGRPWRAVLLDIFYCTVRYGSGHVDYEAFRMYEKNSKQRNEILTVGKNNKLYKQFNDLRYINYFESKAMFNKKFNAYVKRDWMLVGEGIMYGQTQGTALPEEARVEGRGSEAFREFLKDKEYIIAKPLGLSCGTGIEKIKVSDWDVNELYEHLVKDSKPLVEEVVRQHPTMDLLCSTSVNTIRVITILKDGEARIVAGGIRMGQNGIFVDNFNAGGIGVVYDLKTGVVISDGYDKQRRVYKTVPESGVTLKGFQIPLWDEVVSLVKEASLVVPQVGYVGWDVAISADRGPLLIEGNSYPGQDNAQEPDLDAGTYSSIMRILYEG
ncbi:MAG: hypothetical protein K6D56_04250 [Clostridia bacterium]|nr:hypothetical protein [Clostridia bacterium]